MPAEDLPDEFAITLRKPIAFGKDGSETTYVIPLREPTIDEIDTFTKNIKKHGEIGALKYLIAAISEVPFVIVAKMGARDMTIAQEYLLAFFKGSQPTGDSSLE